MGLSSDRATTTGSTTDHYLTTGGVSEDLRKRSVRGAAATGIGQGTVFLLRFGSTAVLARLLTPEDYGLVAMTTVVTGFLGVFKDAGLASATIQREKISHAQISTLFWLNASLGCLIALLLIALSPAVAHLYGEERLTRITCSLAVTFVLGGLTVQHQALLRRHMRFTALATLEICSVAAGVGVAILMGNLGMGYWSLVGMAAGTAATNALGVWVVMPWRPGPPRRGSNTLPMLKFGSDVLLFDIVNYFARQADNLLIGRYWGSAALGLYSKAYSLLMLPLMQINAPLSAVAVPALARARFDPAQFSRFYLNALRLLASATIPLVAGVALLADEVVLFWLGPDWSETASLFRLLAVAAAIRAITNPVGWLLIALGHTRKYRQLGLLNSIIIVLSFVVGLPHGASGVALSYSAAMALLFLPTWWFTLHGTDIRLSRVLQALTPPLAATLPAAVLAFVVLNLGALEARPGIAAITAALAFGGAYALLLLIGFHQWSLFRGIGRELRGK